MDDLIEASYVGDYDKVKELLENGASADVFDALMYASGENYENIARLLLDNGANPNLQDKVGWTVLMIASEFGNKNIVQMLLECGADPNIQADEGYKAFDLAKTDEIREILLGLPGPKRAKK